MNRLSLPSIAVTAAVALTAIAGFVDAMCYLALVHVYTANMSGNSIAVGMDAARGQWRDSARRAFPVAAFMVGLTLAGFVIEISRIWQIRRRLSIALSLELACLIAFVFLANPALGAKGEAPRVLATHNAALVALAAIAMGAQNASLREAGVLNTYTTHVTGTLTRLSHATVRYGCQIATGRTIGRRVRAAHLWFLAGLWVVYVVGAASGAAAWERSGLALMFVPAGLVAVIIAADLVHPLAARTSSVVSDLPKASSAS